MIAPRDLPTEYKAWNRRWHSPFGRQGWLAPRLGHNRLGVLYRGLFGIQPNNTLREFEYPWAYTMIGAQGRKLDIVEVGGGLSGFQFVLAREGHRVVNVDPGCEAKGKGWPVQVDYHRYLCRIFKAPVQLIPTTINKASLESSCTDVVLSISVVEHLTGAELAEVARHIGRILKPGGIAVLTVDLFLDIIPFTKQPTNRWGMNVDVLDLLTSSGLMLQEGDPRELYGFPQFDPNNILENLPQYMMSRGYPCLSQCLVARKPRNS